MTEITSLAALAAPWLSALFGIGTAVAAERAFQTATHGEPPDRWPGDDSHDTDIAQDSADMCFRACARNRAAALQSIATFLGAGTAIEAAAASQVGLIAAALVLLGIVIAVGPSVARWVKASNEIAMTKAHFFRMTWSHDRKYIASQDWAVEDAAFAEEHPREASLLERDKSSHVG